MGGVEIDDDARGRLILLAPRAQIDSDPMPTALQ